MFFMIILLYKEEYYEDLLNSLVESGINDSFVIEGQTINQAVNINLPIFSGLKYRFKDSERYSKIIFSTIKDKNQFDYFINVFKDYKIDLNKEEVIRIYILKLDSVFGKDEEFKIE